MIVYTTISFKQNVDSVQMLLTCDWMVQSNHDRLSLKFQEEIYVISSVMNVIFFTQTINVTLKDPSPVQGLGTIDRVSISLANFYCSIYKI